MIHTLHVAARAKGRSPARARACCRGRAGAFRWPALVRCLRRAPWPTRSARPVRQSVGGVPRFWTDDRTCYDSPWFEGSHRVLIPFGCTKAPYYPRVAACSNRGGIHHGIDIDMPVGTRIYSNVSGTVVKGSLGAAYGPKAFVIRTAKPGLRARSRRHGLRLRRSARGRRPAGGPVEPARALPTDRTCTSRCARVGQLRIGVRAEGFPHPNGEARLRARARRQGLRRSTVSTWWPASWWHGRTSSARRTDRTCTSRFAPCGQLSRRGRPRQALHLTAMPGGAGGCC